MLCLTLLINYDVNRAKNRGKQNRTERLFQFLKKLSIFYNIFVQFIGIKKYYISTAEDLNLVIVDFNILCST